MADWWAIWCVCGWSSVQDLLWKIWSLIVLYSTNIATQNIKCMQEVGGGALPFIVSHFLIISHLSVEACWFIYKQNTHVSSLISLCLDCSHHSCCQSCCLLIKAGPSSSTGLKCGCLCVCFCLERSLSHSTHTLCDIQVGLQHLWRYLTWHKGAGRKMSFNFMDRENGAFCRGEEQAKQIGFILR